MVSRYPYIDRNPCIVAAGKSFGNPCEKVQDCFNDIGDGEKVEAVRKQFGLTDIKDYGPNRKSTEYSGVFSEIIHCLSPPEKSQFQCIDDDIKSTTYDSYWNRPLGKVRDQTPALPKGMDPSCTTFGKCTKSSISAKELVNPLKTPGQIIYEDNICHDLYKFSHGNYYPGEKLQRSYGPPFQMCRTFGVPSNANHSGSRTKKILTWFNDDPISNVSRIQGSVRERTSAPIGQTLDRTGVSFKFDINHSFGKPITRNDFGVEDLLNEFTPSRLKRDVRDFISYANKLRQKIQKIVNTGDMMLEELYEEFLKLDQDNKCELHFDCINQICKRYFIYMDRKKIQPLLLLLGILKPNGMIQYKDFINFLDWNKDFPQLKKEHYIMPPEYQAHDKVAASKMMDSECRCRNILNEPAGLPSNPSRKSGPYYALSRVNIDNLGTESTARSLISPSIYTQYGLSHRDFFKPRTKTFLSNLFKKIGCNLSDEEVEEIFTDGLQMDKTGGVCVETFRNLLDAKVYKTYQRL